jgi:hypothetical protein
MSVSHPIARTQDISTCRPFSASANGSSTPGSLLFLLHRSILLKQDACYPVVHICQHSIHFMERVVYLLFKRNAFYLDNNFLYLSGWLACPWFWYIASSRYWTVQACMLLKEPDSETSFLSWRKGCVAPESLVHSTPVHPTQDRANGNFVEDFLFCIGLCPVWGSELFYCFLLLGCVSRIRIRLKKSRRASLVQLWPRCFFSIPSGPRALPFFILLKHTYILFL